MTGEFMREERYIVFKMSDLGNSLKGDEIRRLAREYAEHRQRVRKKPLECVVVEKDWPEYEPTWKAIEARVTGAQPAPDGTAAQTAARILNIDLIRQRDALRAKIEQMEQQEPVGVLHVGSYYGEEIEDWEFEADQRVCDRLNERHITNPTSLNLYAFSGARTQLNEIKTALQRALELGQRETWTGARKHRSREDQREEQQCWNKVWSLLGAQGEEK